MIATDLILILVAGFGAGFVNAVAGGGTLLTFPALLVAGLSPIAANATSTVAIWPGSVASSWAYRQHLNENRGRVVWFALPSLVGGLLGAILLLRSGEQIFRAIVPYLILLACGLLMVNEPLGRWMAARAAAHPRKHAVALWLCQFAIALYGGYFGAGIGILMLAAMAIFLPEDLQAANGMKNFLAVLINGVAALYFLVIGAAVLPTALVMMGAAIAGGVVGARAAQRMPARWLRLAVVIFGLIVAGKLLMARE
jgi:uncharacterized membrane protein YfcA